MPIVELRRCAGGAEPMLLSCVEREHWPAHPAVKVGFGNPATKRKERGCIMRRDRASHQGQSLLEFALVLPILLIVTFGIIEFGILVYNQQIITNASREGARAGIVASDPRVPPSGANSIDAVVQQYCANNLISFDAQNPPVTTVSGYEAKAPFRQNLQVQVSYQYSFLVMPNFIPGLNKVRSMNAVAVMRYE